MNCRLVQICVPQALLAQEGLPFAHPVHWAQRVSPSELLLKTCVIAAQLASTRLPLVVPPAIPARPQIVQSSKVATGHQTV
jgi:hypothetical protein